MPCLRWMHKGVGCVQDAWVCCNYVHITSIRSLPRSYRGIRWRNAVVARNAAHICVLLGTFRILVRGVSCVIWYAGICFHPCLGGPGEFDHLARGFEEGNQLMACFSWCLRWPGAYWVWTIPKLISGENWLQEWFLSKIWESWLFESIRGSGWYIDVLDMVSTLRAWALEGGTPISHEKELECNDGASPQDLSTHGSLGALHGVIWWCCNP